VLRAQPLAASAFAASAVSLAGLPPSGGFVGKWLLLQAALESGQWWWALPLAVGGLLTAAYTLRVVGRAFTAAPALSLRPAPRGMAWATLGLSLGAVALGLAAPAVLALLDIGSPSPFSVVPTVLR
ncbi:MAG: hypothetical protein IH608_08220, partial [Proteobacteria bacterium]|nr:hypothetical protein [Pseudomonadota bacterium]